MDKGGFCLAEIGLSWGRPVMTQVHMVSPETFQQTIVCPGVVGRCHAVSGFVATVASQPEDKGRCRTGSGEKEQSGKHQVSESSLLVKVSLSTVRAASCRRVWSSMSNCRCSRSRVSVSSSSACCSPAARVSR